MLRLWQRIDHHLNRLVLVVAVADDNVSRNRTSHRHARLSLLRYVIPFFPFVVFDVDAVQFLEDTLRTRRYCLISAPTRAKRRQEVGQLFERLIHDLFLFFLLFIFNILFLR